MQCIFQAMIDDRRFEEIYNEHKMLVFNLCLQYVLNYEDAQDVSQEVFVKIHQRFHQFNPEAASLKTWIYRITINQSLDFVKARNTKKRFGFITSLFSTDNNEPIDTKLHVEHPGITLENKKSLEQLMLIIYALPPNQKTAIILSKIEDRPQRQVAEIMNTSVKAIESLLQRAKQTIEKKLQKTEGI